MKYWECPECGDTGQLPDNSTARYCGFCAGDTGRDVAIRFIKRDAAEVEASTQEIREEL
jgi:hypothetical protein